MAVQVEKPAGSSGTPAATAATTATPKKPTRQERIDKVIANGKPFKYVEKILQEGFTCICGAKGKHANVVTDKTGAKVLVGDTCMKNYMGLTAPKTVKAGKTGSTPPAKL